MNSCEPVLVVVVGPTASGKSALAMSLAHALEGEVISCDSVAVYKGLDIGSAKPSRKQRREVVHHGLDLLDPDQATTAGDFATYARAQINMIHARGRVPILAGGTGLYVRATLDGLAPAPKRDEHLRDRLRARVEKHGSPSLHRLLRRLDPSAAGAIHPHDTPKLIRSLEVTILGHQPQSQQWQTGREALSGFRIVQIGLNPPRSELYARINQRAAAMFAEGLVQETASIVSRFGEDAGALKSLGYAQALALLQGRQTEKAAVLEAQQGHRNYAKRQLTWFRRDQRISWVDAFGDAEPAETVARHMVQRHLIPGQFEKVDSNT